MKITVKTNAFQAISDALHEGIVSGMNRCDKYHQTQLEDTQRQLLLDHITNYFWLALEEAGVELE